METTLHHQLKERFREKGSEIEVKLGRYRIDVVNGERLVEIQRSGLSAIRDKINNLLAQGYLVDVVKPLVARKRLVKLSRKNGKEVDRRWSPRKGTILSVFDELVYFTRVFPHPNLRLITPLVTIEEIRYPGNGRRRRRRRNAFQVLDRQIIDIVDMHSFETVIDLQKLLPNGLPKEFDTKDLAAGLSVDRHDAQRIAYVMRKTGAIVQTGKRGNAIVCRKVTQREATDALKKKRPKKRVSLASQVSMSEAMEKHLARKAKLNKLNKLNKKKMGKEADTTSCDSESKERGLKKRVTKKRAVKKSSSLLGRLVSGQSPKKKRRPNKRRSTKAVG